MFHRLRVFLVVVAVMAAVAAVAIGPAFAAKGGNHGGNSGHGGKHGGKTSSATLVVSPDPPPAYSVIQVTGCGYLVGVPAEIGYVTTVGASVGGVTVDSNGCIATSLPVYGPGSYSVGVQQYINGSWVVEASTTFVAY